MLKQNKKPKKRPRKRLSNSLLRRDKVKRSHLGRINTVYGLVFISLTSLILRLAYLQIAHGAEFHRQATADVLESVPVLPARGRIFDSNGTLLAYDEPVYNVYLTQTKVTPKQLPAVASILATQFKTTTQKVLGTVESQKQYATIKLFTNISQQQLAFIMENRDKLPGITVELDSERQYPYGVLAGHVLGYVGPITSETKSYYVDQLKYLQNEQVGETGLESEYNSILEGQVGQQMMKVSSTGQYIQDAGMNPAPVSGDNLQLTLDAHLQAQTQDELTSFIDKSPFKSTINDAAAIMLDVKTGGVLSLVSYPYYNPNWYTVPGQMTKFAQYLKNSGAQQNNAIQNPNYPGSTVKPANLLTGLEKGVITPQTAYNVPYNIMIAGAPKHDDAPHGFVDDAKAITVSSDVFFYNIGLWLAKWMGAGPGNGGAPAGGVSLQQWRNVDFAKGMIELFNGEARFGLGGLTGIDLPGEQKGRFYVMDERKNYAAVQFPLQEATESVKKTGKYVNYSTPVSIALAGIGQEQQFTPIQLAQYVATIANGGKRIEPHVLQAVYPPSLTDKLSSSAKPVKEAQPVVQANLHLNQNYLKIVQQGMYGVCNDPQGTAYADFQNAPYKAAGKTGTADIYLGGQHMTNSVFIAYAPYDNPQVAVAVMVPGGGYGADSAAAVARNMMDTYFKEHHEFFPESQWETTTIPASWMTSAANTVFQTK